jgi:CMP-2-keto-3-deoxyoctulosonic acid synthetase
MKKRDVVVIAADDDDEVRTSVSQNHVTVTLCTEESSSGLRISSEVWGEAGNKTSTRHIQTVLTEFPVSAKPPC